jgi:hypothetical protein
VQPPALLEPPALVFYGVVMEGGTARAILRGPGNESLRVRIGDKVGDWTVTELDRRQMVLSFNGRSEVMTLFAKGARQSQGLPTHLEEAAPRVGPPRPPPRQSANPPKAGTGTENRQRGQVFEEPQL